MDFFNGLLRERAPIGGRNRVLGTVVCKFGGSSLADERQVVQVREIVESDARRRFIVPSAPGKRNDSDTKITDLLYLCHELARQNLDFSGPYSMIRARYEELAAKLGIRLDIGQLLDRLKISIENGASPGFCRFKGASICVVG